MFHTHLVLVSLQVFTDTWTLSVRADSKSPTPGFGQRCASPKNRHLPPSTGPESTGRPEVLPPSLESGRWACPLQTRMAPRHEQIDPWMGGLRGKPCCRKRKWMKLPHQALSGSLSTAMLTRTVSGREGQPREGNHHSPSHLKNQSFPAFMPGRS